MAFRKRPKAREPELETVRPVLTDSPLKLEELPELNPTMEEFMDMGKFIKSKVVQDAGRKFGIVKVVTPVEFEPSLPVKDIDNLLGKIPKFPVLRQCFKPMGMEDGVFLYEKTEELELSAREFMAEADKAVEELEEYWTTKSAKKLDEEHEYVDENHRKYWTTRSRSCALYAADIQHSVMKPEQKCWNMGSESFPCLTQDLERNLPGVNTPYLYIGSFGSTFGWHTEDADLYSLNYLHEGNAKYWHCIPAKYGQQFEQLLRDLGYDTGKKQCKAFMREKSAVVHPDFLLQRNIPVYHTKQCAGELIITFPYAYHSGFNSGFNIAEARNIATLDWIPFGLAASRCSCRRCPLSVFPLADIEKIAAQHLPDEFKYYKKLKSQKKRYPYHEAIELQAHLNEIETLPTAITMEKENGTVTFEIDDEDSAGSGRKHKKLRK